MAINTMGPGRANKENINKAQSDKRKKDKMAKRLKFSSIAFFILGPVLL